MKLIVGLGNVGREYAGTRHNLGFAVADELARRWHTEPWKEAREAFYTEYRAPEKIYLLKPTTYMNASGRAVGAWAHFYNVAPEDIAVVQDDMDMEIGQTRIRSHGSSGGHNGIKSIQEALGTDAFTRFKIGIGHPLHDQQAVVSHVLHPFTGSQKKLIDNAVLDMASALELWAQGNMDQVMQKYNKKPPKPKAQAVIACFGDSLIQGFPFGPDSSWIKTAAEVTGFKLLNFGENGETCEEILYRLREQPLPPDVRYILFMGGMNDLLQQRTIYMIMENLRQAAAFCADKHWKLGLVLPYMCADPTLNLQVQALRLQMQQEFSSQWQHSVSGEATVPAAPVHKNVRLLDFQSLFPETTVVRSAMFLDGVHPTADTYVKLGKFAAPWLQKWVRR